MQSPSTSPEARAPRYSEFLAALDLERQVIGAALNDAGALAIVMQLLDLHHFANPRHLPVLETIRQLYSEGAPVNIVSVTEAGRPRGVDPVFITELAIGVGSESNTERFCRIIQERWIARESERAATHAAARFRSGDDVFEVLEDLHTCLNGFVLGRGGDTHIRAAVAEALQQAEDWRRGDASDLCPTGFYSLDQGIGGYPVGELTTFAAMTGAGKTSILLQIATSLALIEMQRAREGRRPRAILIFSAEMSRKQIALRAASNLARIDITELRSGRAQADAYERFSAALGAIAQLPIHVDDEPEPTFSHIAARCQQLSMPGAQAGTGAESDGLAFVGVDYDEKINTEGETEELRVAAIARGLKNTAKRFYVPIVALSQYSRAASYDRMPEDEWLRYSGKKQHESSLILHWMWPNYWVKKGVPPYRKAQGGKEVPNVVGYDEARPERGYIVCNKNRFGGIGKIPLDFEERFTRFVDPGDPEERAKKVYRPAAAPF